MTTWRHGSAHRGAQYGVFWIERREVIVELFLALGVVVNHGARLQSVILKDLVDRHGGISVLDIVGLLLLVFLLCGGRRLLRLLDLLVVLRGQLAGFFSLLERLDPCLFLVFSGLDEHGWVLVKHFDVLYAAMILDDLFVEHHDTLRSEHVDVVPVVGRHWRIA